MTIQGYQFDKCKVTPEADAALYYQLNNKQNHVIAGYKNEMNVTSSGLNVYVDTGCALVMGRYCEITNQEQLSVMANTEGYVCITIDLTETNTAEGVPGSADYVVTNNQLRVELVTELVQQDLFNDGQVYTFPLASFSSSGTAVTISRINDNYATEKKYKKTIAIPTGGVTIDTNKKYAAVITEANGEQYLDINILATFIANPKEGIPLFNIGQTIKRNTIINVISAAGGISNVLRAEVRADGGVYFWGLSTASASYHLTGRYWIV